MIALLIMFVQRIFALLDSMVAWLIEVLYQLIVAIADTNVLGDYIYQFLGRIYVFLGLFMVFKLSISMITYIINPDSFTDKSKGVGKLIQSVVISLILLVTVPTIFSWAFQFQTDILKTNAIYQIVTGKSTGDVTSDSNTLYDNAINNARLISRGIYSGFVYRNSSDGGEEGSAAYCSIDSNLGCKDKVCTTTQCLLNGDVVTNDHNTYWWLISTLAGGFVVYILLGFCIDVALRSVKLSFLQIIAPIPILSMIDPTGKNDKFQKWLKQCTSTFLSLFVRLAALFFSVEIIRLVLQPEDGVKTMTQFSGSEPGGILGIFVKIFIIIGCLMFAKQFPKLLEEILGIKLDGDGFSLKKKMGNIPGMGAAKVLGAGALGFAGGAAANTFAGIKNWDKSKSAWKNLAGMDRSIFAGAFSGACRGLTSKEKGMFKSAGAGIKGAVDARNLRDERNATGDGGINGWISRREADMNKFAGITNDDTAKIAAKRAFGDKLYNDVKNGKYSKYDMDNHIGKDFGKAWEIADNSKDYRNSVNKQLSMAKSDFQAGKSVAWNGKSGAEAIAALEIESAKAGAAYDKASADFKELRSMQEHKSESTYYDAYNAADDRASAEEYSRKQVAEYSNESSSSSTNGAETVGGVSVTPADANGERTTASGIILPPGTKTDQERK